MVSFLEDWKNDENGEIRRVLEFLNLDPLGVDARGAVKLNVGGQRSKHSTLQRMIVKSRLRSLLRWLAGPKLWAYLAAKHAQASCVLPNSELTSGILRDFLDYVREDNQCFLKEWGKPADFWSPAKVTLLG